MEDIDQKFLNELASVKSRLLGNLQSDNFCGYDPFDGLNTPILPILNKLPFGGFFKLALIQLHKRSPVNLRPLFGVKRSRNPKGIALIIMGLLESAEVSDSPEPLISLAQELSEWLYQCRIQVVGGGGAGVGGESHLQSAVHGWGYNFEWQTRAFNVPLGIPNTITTVFVARAFQALYRATGESVHLNAYLGAARFIGQKMYVSRTVGPYYRYIPGKDVCVHNASLWAAALVIEATEYGLEKAYLEEAKKAAYTSVDAQREDGAWVYGERDHHQFVDSFHTGYNLEALHIINKVLNDTRIVRAIEKGYLYYKEHFFTQDGAAKYYDSGVYPIDAHSIAQAMVTSVQLNTVRNDQLFYKQIVKWSFEKLYNTKSGFFFYQRKKYFVNPMNYMRWTQAWMFYSLAKFEKALLQQSINAGEKKYA